MKSRTKVFKIEATVPKKKFGSFFLLLHTMIDIEYSSVRLHSVSWQYWRKLWDQFFGSLKGCLKHIFFERRQFFSQEMYLPYIFSNCRIWQTSENDSKEPKRQFDNWCASNKSFFRTWEFADNTNFWKKGSFPVNKCFCPIFPQIVECDRPQDTIYKRQKDILRINVKVIRVFFRTREVAENTNFWKKGNFPVNKCICPIFSQIVECDKLEERIYKGWKDNLTITVVVKRSFLGPERLLKT